MRKFFVEWILKRIGDHGDMADDEAYLGIPLLVMTVYIDIKVEWRLFQH
jgi:hypothetical protein